MKGNKSSPSRQRFSLYMEALLCECSSLPPVSIPSHGPFYTHPHLQAHLTPQFLHGQPTLLLPKLTYASVRKAALHPYRKERLTTCRMKVAYCSCMTGMEAHRVKPRVSRDVRASEGTMEQRATVSDEEPGSEGNRGACGCTQRRAGNAKKDQNEPNRTRSYLNTNSSMLITVLLHVNQMCPIVSVPRGFLTHSEIQWPLNRLHTHCCPPQPRTGMMMMVMIMIVYTELVIARD